MREKKKKKKHIKTQITVKKERYVAEIQEEPRKRTMEREIQFVIDGGERKI